jgi:hypothetical protein
MVRYYFLKALSYKCSKVPFMGFRGSGGREFLIPE